MDHRHFATLLLALQMCCFLSAQDTMRVVGKGGQRLSLMEEWRKIPRDSNRSFVAAQSDRAAGAPSVFHAGTFLPGSEDALKNAKALDVVGPFRKANADFVLRLDSVGMTSDSVQAAHILISFMGSASTSLDVRRTRVQAKKTADSLCALISSGQVIFENVVVQITDDPGSKSGNLGNYGWFTRESPFIEPFKQGAFSHAVGVTFVIESDFGFHIMQVKAKTRAYQSYFAWEIVKIIDTCFTEDGVTPMVWPGGFAQGNDALDRLIARQRLQYASIAKPTGSGSVMVVFDISPAGFVSGVRLDFAEGLTPRQRTDITKLFMSLRGFTPQRTCAGLTGQTEVYMFRL